METYGICLDEAMEGRYSAPFVASLCEQLPTSCRWRVSYEPDAWWDGDRVLMANILNNLRGLIWGMSDKAKRGPEPKPVGPSWMKGQRKVKVVAMGADELMRVLSRPRIGGDDG